MDPRYDDVVSALMNRVAERAAGGAASASTGGATDAVMPLGEAVFTQTWPARLLKDAWSAATSPGDAAMGRYDPVADAAENGLFSRAGMLGGLALTGQIPNAGLASRAVRMYDPPSVPARRFELDYPPSRWPDGPPVDAAGRLTRDIEGRPLVAENVVGRRDLAGGEHALPAEALDAVAAAGTGGRTPIWASRIPGGGLGSVELEFGSRNPRQVWYQSSLSGPARSRVQGHEVGHVIDLVAGAIPQKGLSSELKELYNTLNNGRRDPGGGVATWGKPSTPQSAGYSKAEAPAEFMAEAVRAYMADPNYMKTVAPKTAAAIRAAVNENPTLSPHIQFNAGGTFGFGLFGLRDQQDR